jgi:hypothetical protein
LNREIRQASPFRWSGAEAVGSDLLRRTVVLVIRVEADPSTSEFVAFWEPLHADVGVRLVLKGEIERPDVPSRGLVEERSAGCSAPALVESDTG